MMRRAKLGAGAAESVHGERPWVYFMIDCFFLVTQFFVITFHVRSNEGILRQKIPPGGTVGVVGMIDQTEPVVVFVKHDVGTAPTYTIMKQDNTLAQLSDVLGSVVAVRGANRVKVRISYEKDVPFGDVMAVFNLCTNFKITECGLAAVGR